jgi:hypothetical protein
MQGSNRLRKARARRGLDDDPGGARGQPAHMPRSERSDMPMSGYRFSEMVMLLAVARSPYCLGCARLGSFPAERDLVRLGDRVRLDRS